MDVFSKTYETNPRMETACSARNYFVYRIRFLLKQMVKRYSNRIILRIMCSTVDKITPFGKQRFMDENVTNPPPDGRGCRRSANSSLVPVTLETSKRTTIIIYYNII